MPTLQHNPDGVFPPYRAYSQATEVRGDARMLFISGLNGYESDGTTSSRALRVRARGLVAQRPYGPRRAGGFWVYSHVVPIEDSPLSPTLELE